MPLTRNVISNLFAFGYLKGLLHIILLSPRIRRRLWRDASMVRHRGPTLKLDTKSPLESLLRESKVSSEAQRRMLPLWLGTQRTFFQAQPGGSPLRLSHRGYPLGFGTRISYLDRLPTSCRRFAMRVPLIGIGVRQPLCRRL